MQNIYLTLNKSPSKGGLSKTQVRKLAEQYGIKIPKGIKKDELWRLILNQVGGDGYALPIPTNYLSMPPTPLRLPPSPIPSVPSLPSLPSLPSQVQQRPQRPFKPLPQPPVARPLKPLPPIPKQNIKAAQFYYNELIQRIIISYDMIRCCINQYSAQKPETQNELNGFNLIKEKLLEPLLAQYRSFLLYYTILQKENPNPEKIINLIATEIPKIVSVYIRGMNYIYTNLPKKILQKIFPPPGFKEYNQETTNCIINNKDSKFNDKTTLLCIQIYIIQIITRFTMPALNILKNMPSQPVKNLVNVLETETNKINETQKYINSQLWCRPDYCDPNYCTKKSNFFRSTCDAKYQGIDNINWYDKFTQNFNASK